MTIHFCQFASPHGERACNPQMMPSTLSLHHSTPSCCLQTSQCPLPAAKLISAYRAFLKQTAQLSQVDL